MVIITTSHPHLTRNGHSTITPVMPLKEILAFVDLKVHQDTGEKLGLQDWQELKD